MQFKLKPQHQTALACALLTVATMGLHSLPVGASCGSAFCTINTNWMAPNVWSGTGSSLNLRYEFINQDQPRSGTDAVGVGQIPSHHDEVKTTNRNYLLTYHHKFDPHWSLSTTLPALDREHFHIHNHHGTPIPEHWAFTELGDMRVVGGYQLSIPGTTLQPGNFGFTFGLKLPTGKFTVANADGDIAERSLQPGSGTTDAILGINYHQNLPKMNSAWFAQAQAQHAMNSRSGFKPGNQVGGDIGYSYNLTEKLGAMLQLNALVKGRDRGAEAEPDESGGKYLSLSPGLGYAVNGTTRIYGFVQLPVYQNVNGLQLTADKSIVVGLSSRL